MKLGRVQKVYVIYNEEFNITKIGISDDPYNRMNTLSMECGCELTLCFHTDPLDDAPRYEKLVHNALSDKRKRGEWFRVTPEEAIKTVKDVIKDAETDPILMRYRNGVPISKIAKDFDVSRQAIIYRLDILGVHGKELYKTEPITDELLKIDPKYVYSQCNKQDYVLQPPKNIINNAIEIDETPPKGVSGFKRLEPNLYFNGEWYQISLFKDGSFKHAYTRNIDKAREYIKQTLITS